MAVDTANKRASVLGLTLTQWLVAPTPDAAIATTDRAHLAGAYRLSDSVTLTAVSSRTWRVPIDYRTWEV